MSGTTLGTDKAQPLPPDDVILWEEGVERRQKERQKHNVNNVTTEVCTGSYGKPRERGSSSLSGGATPLKA